MQQDIATTRSSDGRDEPANTIGLDVGRYTGTPSALAERSRAAHVRR